MSANRFSQTQKVAILLLSLGEDTAAEIMSKLPAADVTRIGRALASIDRVDQETVDAVMHEFFEQLDSPATLRGGQAATRSILEKALGRETAEAMTGSTGLPALAEYHPESLAGFLRHERPQTIALVLAHLEPTDFKETLKLLPESLYTEVLMRLAQLDRVDQKTLANLNEALAEEARHRVNAGHRVGGPATAARLINALGHEMGRDLLDRLKERDPDLSDRVRSHMVSFEDILRISPASMPKFLAQVDRGQLLLAMKLASPAVIEKICTSMSARARELLDDDFAAQPKTPRTDVEAAQRSIAEIVHQLHEEEEIHFDDDDEYV